MTERSQTNAQIARLEARVTVLEQVIFQLNPSALRPNIDSVEAVKNFCASTTSTRSRRTSRGF
ncbi:hypothetical protein AB7M71_003330 [Bradyrhizobium japonicum]